MLVNIFRKIRYVICHKWFIDSRCGSFFLNIVAVCGVASIFSIKANVVVVAVNDGRMPVVVPAGEIYDFTERHIVADDATNLRFLGDIIIINEDTIYSDSFFVEVMAKMTNFPLDTDIIASPGDVGMWVFTGAAIFILFFLLTYVLCLGIKRCTKKLFFA